MGLTWFRWTCAEYFLSTIWKLGPVERLDEATLLQTLKKCEHGPLSLLSLCQGTQATASGALGEQQSHEL